ncbi:MAG: hypothetical protein COB50_02525 [Thiotrichales bacterium]|nr:MAG: hypothetical protein COB50_02525 [Thiotrichales bacterium]
MQNTDYCFHELFEKQARKTPNNIALVYQDGTKTYAQLNSEVNQLARHLISLGIKSRERFSEDVVAILLPRSPEMLISLLAVMKTGAAYIPLESADTAANNLYKLQDSKAKLVIGTTKTLKFLHNDGEVKVSIATLNLQKKQKALSRESNSNLSLEYDLNSLAYMIYSSGTTGYPKAIAVEHKGLAQRLQAHDAILRITPNDCIFQFASFRFDASLMEIMLALGTGASLKLSTAAHLDKLKFLPKLFEETGNKAVSIAILTPTMLKNLQDESYKFKHLRAIISTGEASAAKLLAHWQNDRNIKRLIINGYGPTEATIGISLQQFTDGKVTLGAKAMRGLKFYMAPLTTDEKKNDADAYDIKKLILLDGLETNQDIEGELCVSGTIARGYYKNGQLDKAKMKSVFISANDPENPQKKIRVYRTGDIGILNNGKLHFVGRKDHQVQIAGIRVEPESVEVKLKSHNNIKNVVVLGQKTPKFGKRLVAFIKLKDKNKKIYIEDLNACIVGNDSPDGLKNNPEIPSCYYVVTTIPETINNKTNKKHFDFSDFCKKRGIQLTKKNHLLSLQKFLKHLQAEQLTNTKLSVDGSPEYTHEKLIRKIWSEVLNMPEIKIHRNASFTILGGCSLNYKMMLSLVENAVELLQFDINLAFHLHEITIKSLAQHIFYQMIYIKAVSDLNRVTQHSNNQQTIVKQSHKTTNIYQTDNTKFYESKDEQKHMHQSRNILLGRANSYPAIFCIHPITGKVDQYKTLTTKLKRYPLYTVESPIFSNKISRNEKKFCYTHPELLPQTVETMARYMVMAIMRVQKPPYVILGWSFGGLLAYEISKQLHKLHIEHSLLLIDPTNPTIEKATHTKNLIALLSRLSKQIKLKYPKVKLTFKKLNKYANQKQITICFNYLLQILRGTKQNLSSSVYNTTKAILITTQTNLLASLRYKLIKQVPKIYLAISASGLNERNSSDRQIIREAWSNLTEEFTFLSKTFSDTNHFNIMDTINSAKWMEVLNTAIYFNSCPKALARNVLWQNVIHQISIVYPVKDIQNNLYMQEKRETILGKIKVYEFANNLTAKQENTLIDYANNLQKELEEKSKKNPYYLKARILLATVYPRAMRAQSPEIHKYYHLKVKQIRDYRYANNNELSAERIAWFNRLINNLSKELQVTSNIYALQNSYNTGQLSMSNQEENISSDKVF